MATEVRASDAERERVVSRLRAHAAEGRLDLEELDQRTGAALAARTHGELAALTADLPRLRRTPAERARLRRAALRIESSVYLGVMAMLVLIWLLTSTKHPWPIYPAVGWGVPLLLQWKAAAPTLRSAGR